MIFPIGKLALSLPRPHRTRYKYLSLDLRPCTISLPPGQSPQGSCPSRHLLFWGSAPSTCQLCVALGSEDNPVLSQEEFKELRCLVQAPQRLVKCISAFIPISGWEVRRLPLPCDQNRSQLFWALLLGRLLPHFTPASKRLKTSTWTPPWSSATYCHMFLMPKTSLANKYFMNEWIPSFLHTAHNGTDTVTSGWVSLSQVAPGLPATMSSLWKPYAVNTSPAFLAAPNTCLLLEGLQDSSLSLSLLPYYTALRSY